MTVATRSTGVLICELGVDEREHISEVAGALASVDLAVDTAAWVNAARDGWERLPVRLREAVRGYRRSSGEQGALLLRGVLDEIPGLGPTPSDPVSVQRTPSVGAALLTMIATGIGDPAAFRPEKKGCLVQDVVPVPGKEAVQGNAGSVDLSFHIENAFHRFRPDHVILLCLRPDHERVAALKTASIRMIAPLLSETARGMLSSPVFETAAPPSFGSIEGADRHAVIAGSPDDPDLRVDLHATVPLTNAAASALSELAGLLESTAQRTRLDAGDLVMVDNRIAAHGRSAFSPRYDGSDRWLQRTFAFNDLRCSRAARRDDGYVID